MVWVERGIGSRKQASEHRMLRGGNGVVMTEKRVDGEREGTAIWGRGMFDLVRVDRGSRVA